MNDIVQLKIMASQCGLEVGTQQIEVALLQGVDTKRAVLAMSHAKKTDTEVTWQEIVDYDMKTREQVERDF